MQFDNTHEQKKLISIIKSYALNGNFKKAIQTCNYLNHHFPCAVEGWYITSCLALQLNNQQHAITAIRKALLLQPETHQLRLHEIHCLAASGKKEKAIERALLLADSNVNDVSICDELAKFFNSYQHYIEAKKLYTIAINLEPNNERLHYNLGSVQQYLGEIKNAVISCDTAININRHYYDAHFLRSSLVKQSNFNNHVKVLQKILSEKIEHPIGYAKISYALAKELEDCGEYESSFIARTQGAKVYRQQMNYNIKSDIAFINKVIENYDHNQFVNKSNYSNNEAIFILGLPRSGTTLLERIISNHSEVFSAGELTNFPEQMSKMMQTLTASSEVSRTNMVRLSTRLNFPELGRAYIKSTRPETKTTAHFIDKFPQNALYAGLIHKALPKAKIILLQRHPLDVCYAMYKQLFTDIYHFSYDLEELAEYFIAHQKLMDHWQQVIPEAIKVVRYEDLVLNIQTVTKKLLNDCGLDWQPQCLDFHNNTQASTTASASQVREKLYTSSIGLWKNYEKQLTSLKNSLEKAGCLDNWAS